MAKENILKLIGNIGKEDPREYTTNEGKTYVGFSLCVQSSYQNEQEQWVKGQENWFFIRCFGEAAGYARNFHSGMRVKILGYLTSFNASDQEGRLDTRILINAYKADTAFLTKKANSISA